jgi:outer membrane protein OmpA-like peptidoglycan-associated protein
LAEKEKFIATSNNLSTKNLQAYKEIQQDLYLTPIEVGQTIRLNNIFFDTDKFALRNESTAELNRLVRILNENPAMSIEVMGHTDAVGNDQNNMTLSQNRADAVKEYLLNKGVASNRLSSKGFGKTKPLASNDTEEGRQMNRRVEFSIVK